MDKLILFTLLTVALFSQLLKADVLVEKAEREIVVVRIFDFVRY